MKQGGGRRADNLAWVDWVAAQGVMGARVAEFDWGGTGLGPIADWPTELRDAVTLCLGSLFPTSIRWGENLIVIHNDACREIYGEERFNSALGRTSAEVWPEATPAVGDALDRLMNQGLAYSGSDRMIPLNRDVPAEECYLTFSYTPIVDHDGRVAGVFSTFFETTKAVLAERRLSTIASLGRELADCRTAEQTAAAAAAVLAANTADHPAGALYRSPGPGSDPGEPVMRFGSVLDEQRCWALVRDCAASGVPQHSDAGATEAGGLHAYGVWEADRQEASHVLVLAHHRARPWDASLAAYLALLASTLGGALITQSELWAERQRAAQATALEATKSAFFANVSHELRTPLSLIAGPLELALSEKLNQQTRRELELAHGSTARLTRMVDALLDFHRMEAGRIVPDLQPVPVARLTADLAASFEPIVEEAGLEFHLQLGDLGREPMLDVDFYERIFSNLISNAIKYTSEGSVSVRLAAAGADYLLEVSDTGRGIPDGDRERIFGRFERLPAPGGSAARPGVGIGLAMVRELTEILGGEVSVQSVLGQGSKFTVRLPFEPPQPARAEGQSITPRRTASFVRELSGIRRSEAEMQLARGTGPRLLLAEDDPQMAAFLAEALSSDYEVEVTSDGEQALAAIRRRRPDLVLTDLSMPKMDGLKLVAAIRAEAGLRDLPVLMLSGRAGQDDTVLGLSEGADDFLAKPFSLVDLRARLAAHLSRARERSTVAEWRRAVLSAVQDGVVVLDEDGEVLELNQAFTDLLGYSLADGPIRPPYPWWPTREEDPATRANLDAFRVKAAAGESVTKEFRIYSKDRRPVWVLSTGAMVRDHLTGRTAAVRTLRDISRQKAAQERRAAAAQLSADFASADDLAGLIAVAEHSLKVLFEGAVTIQLSLASGATLCFHDGARVSVDDLPPAVASGLASDEVAAPQVPVPGIRLAPPSGDHRCLAWIGFPAPRQLGSDELIVADLLAQALALAVDRTMAAERQANLQQAVVSHREIGQAVGVLVERHRVLPEQAFELLKKASQRRNLKLRELAARVVSTGAEPDEA